MKRGKNYQESAKLIDATKLYDVENRIFFKNIEYYLTDLSNTKKSFCLISKNGSNLITPTPFASELFAL